MTSSEERDWSSRVEECPECSTHRGIVTAVQLPGAEPEEIGRQERADVQHAAAQHELAELRREEAVVAGTHRSLGATGRSCSPT